MQHQLFCYFKNTTANHLDRILLFLLNFEILWQFKKLLANFEPTLIKNCALGYDCKCRNIEKQSSHPVTL